MTEDERVYTLKEDSIIFHAPMEFHRIKSAGGSSPSVRVMSFTASGELPDQLKSAERRFRALRSATRAPRPCPRKLLKKFDQNFHQTDESRQWVR